MRSQDGSLPETIVVSMPVADIETTTMPSNGPEKPKKRQDREKAAMRLRSRCAIQRNSASIPPNLRKIGTSSGALAAAQRRIADPKRDGG